MAKDKPKKKGQAPKIKPEVHKKGTLRKRAKSHDQWTALCRKWARMDPNTRKLSQAILAFGLRKGGKFSLPTPRVFSAPDLDKQGSTA